MRRKFEDKSSLMGVGTLPKSQLQVVRNFWRESMTGVCVCWGPSHTGCEWSAVTSGARVWGQLHPGTETAQSLCISVHPRGHTSGITSVSAHAHPQPNHAVNARSATGQCACTRSCVCVMVTPLTWLGQLAVILTEETDGDDPESEDVSDIVCVTNVITMFCFVSSVSIHSYCQGSLPISELVLS